MMPLDVMPPGLLAVLAAAQQKMDAGNGEPTRGQLAEFSSG